jgi:mono/diheme cytochrome c family protein
LPTVRIGIRNTVLVVLVTVGFALVAVACGGGGGDIATPTDPVLAEGQNVYRANCASCHGTKGGGGQGPKLAGVVEAKWTLEQHMAIIAGGRGAGMPKFESRLTPEQIEAVARYEREVL